MKNSRRDFLKKGALAGFGALMIPEIAKAAVKKIHLYMLRRLI